MVMGKWFYIYSFCYAQFLGLTTSFGFFFSFLVSWVFFYPISQTFGIFFCIFCLFYSLVLKRLGFALTGCFFSPDIGMDFLRISLVILFILHLVFQMHSRGYRESIWHPKQWACLLWSDFDSMHAYSMLDLLVCTYTLIIPVSFLALSYLHSAVNCWHYFLGSKNLELRQV